MQQSNIPRTIKTGQEATTSKVDNHHVVTESVFSFLHTSVESATIYGRLSKKKLTEVLISCMKYHAKNIETIMVPYDCGTYTEPSTISEWIESASNRLVHTRFDEPITEQCDIILCEKISNAIIDFHTWKPDSVIQQILCKCIGDIERIFVLAD